MKILCKSLFVLLFLVSCSTSDTMDLNTPFTQDLEDVDPTENENDNNEEETDDTESTDPRDFKLLSLGDSYTIGQNVCTSCRFPEQLKDSLIARFPQDDSFDLQVIAQTGWTTTNLIEAISMENVTDDYDFVTLLIGVNNQYQNNPFSLYETEFPELVQIAISAVKGDKANVVVLSIPDYAFTPFGQGNGNPDMTSEEIDEYNAFAQSYCDQQDIVFLNITDITREGLDNSALIASDGLHPSELAYTRFVERLLPIAIQILD